MMSRAPSLLALEAKIMLAASALDMETASVPLYSCLALGTPSS